jgi:F-type H+-transporting ATPase subunit epsilon
MMHFQLVSASGLKYDGDAYEVLVPTMGGTIAVFEDHMPLISSAQGGVVSVRVKQSDQDKDMEHFAVSGGVMQVEGKNLIFLSDEVTASYDVNEKEAEAALARASQLVDSSSSREDLHEAHRALHHSSAQLHIARLKRRHHS